MQLDNSYRVIFCLGEGQGDLVATPGVMTTRARVSLRVNPYNV